MPRNILLITTDQQRYDSLGCTGGTVASTPNIDKGRGGNHHYRRKSMSCLHAGALDQPDRPACADARRDIERHPIAGGSSDAHELKAAGYSTALIGITFHRTPRSFLRTLRPAKTVLDHIAGSIIWSSPATPGGQAVRCFTIRSGCPKRTRTPSKGSTNTPAAGTPARLAGVIPVRRSPDTPVSMDLPYEQGDLQISNRGDNDKWFCWMSFPDPHHIDAPDRSGTPTV